MIHNNVFATSGRDIAASPLLNVQWPPVALIVPTELETYSNDVEVMVKFTNNLCSQMLASVTTNENEVLPKTQTITRSLRDLPFVTYLELIACPAENGLDCQVHIL